MAINKGASLFEAKSFRDFLQHYVTQQKENNSGLTQNKIAKKIGLSPSLFQMILDGTRKVTVARTHYMAEKLGFRGTEYDYFINLVFYDQAESSRERSYYREKLQPLKAKGAVQKSVKVPFGSLMSDWWVPALIVCALDRPELLSADILAKHFKVKPEMIRESLKKMENLGILAMPKDGSVHLEIDRLAPLFSKQNFLYKLLPVIREKIETEFQSSKHYFESHTYSMPEEKFQNWIEECKALMEKTINDQDPSENGKNRIYQTFISSFPVL